ncbi:putative protein kinase (incomplete catalytic triad) [Neospora caninum Liverpool]|uniref:non-specific serine/threonine protein kinase n=1 Tax=Neospora caninum (strain Liverpool) TaxID=572307 RepID=F0VHP8_NEOCL|nr:putative protein kinase (incomplete catalytic triad) [Neospora caninum Liverpool]CBZ53259.1 putative protein kinase (incomplete catalytic triad) [Neospora caninum Liverpool]CEL67245.1 TPA: protein kinase (incomplete catalytic triad),putative [Neospora caninum Liverpool]|eukprot:XP_003883291.1 putative protein kinase (incomplete catalytic triad) [Neospora caninum Liverpool]
MVPWSHPSGIAFRFLSLQYRNTPAVLFPRSATEEDRDVPVPLSRSSLQLHAALLPLEHAGEHALVLRPRIAAFRSASPFRRDTFGLTVFHGPRGKEKRRRGRHTIFCGRGKLKPPAVRPRRCLAGQNRKLEFNPRGQGTSWLLPKRRVVFRRSLLPKRVRPGPAAAHLRPPRHIGPPVSFPFSPSDAVAVRCPWRRSETARAFHFPLLCLSSRQDIQWFQRVGTECGHGSSGSTRLSPFSTCPCLQVQPEKTKALSESAALARASLLSFPAAPLSACRPGTFPWQARWNGQHAGPLDRHRKHLVSVPAGSRFLDTAAVTERRQRKRRMLRRERFGPSVEFGVCSTELSPRESQRRRRETRSCIVVCVSCHGFVSLVFLAYVAVSRVPDCCRLSKKRILSSEVLFVSLVHRHSASLGCATGLFRRSEDAGFLADLRGSRQRSVAFFCQERGGKPKFVSAELVNARDHLPVCAIFPLSPLAAGPSSLLFSSCSSPPWCALPRTWCASACDFCPRKSRHATSLAATAATETKPRAASSHVLAHASEVASVVCARVRLASFRSSVLSLDLPVDGTTAAQVIRASALPHCLSPCSPSRPAASALFPALPHARIRKSIFRFFAWQARARGGVSESRDSLAPPVALEIVGFENPEAKRVKEEERQRRMTEAPQDNGWSRPQPSVAAGVMPAVCSPSSDCLLADGHGPRVSSFRFPPTHSGLPEARITEDTDVPDVSSSPSSFSVDSVSASAACNHALRRRKLPSRGLKRSLASLWVGNGCLLLCLLAALLLPQPAGELDGAGTRWEGGEEPGFRCRVASCGGDSGPAKDGGRGRVAFAVDSARGSLEETAGPPAASGGRHGGRARGGRGACGGAFEASPLAHADRKNVSLEALAVTVSSLEKAEPRDAPPCFLASSDSLSRVSSRPSWRRGTGSLSSQGEEPHRDSASGKSAQQKKTDCRRARPSMARKDTAGARARPRTAADRGGSREAFPSFSLKGDRLLPSLLFSSPLRHSPLLSVRPVLAHSLSCPSLSSKRRGRPTARQDHEVPAYALPVFSLLHSQPRDMQPKHARATADPGGEFCAASAPASLNLSPFSALFDQDERTHALPCRSVSCTTMSPAASAVPPASRRELSEPEGRGGTGDARSAPPPVPSANLSVSRMHADLEVPRPDPSSGDGSSVAKAGAGSPRAPSSLFVNDASSNKTPFVALPARSPTPHGPRQGRARLRDAGKGDSGAEKPQPASVSFFLGRSRRVRMRAQTRKGSDSQGGEREGEESQGARDVGSRSSAVFLSSLRSASRHRGVVASLSQATSVQKAFVEKDTCRESLRGPAPFVGSFHSARCMCASRGVDAPGRLRSACAAGERQGAHCCGGEGGGRGQRRRKGRGDSSQTNGRPRRSSASEAPRASNASHSSNRENRGEGDPWGAQTPRGTEATQTGAPQESSDSYPQLVSNVRRECLSEGEASREFSSPPSSASSLSHSHGIPSSSTSSGSLALHHPSALPSSLRSATFSPQLAAVVATAAAVVRSSFPNVLHASAVSSPPSPGRSDEGGFPGESRALASLPERNERRAETEDETSGDAMERTRASPAVEDSAPHTATFTSRNGVGDSWTDRPDLAHPAAFSPSGVSSASFASPVFSVETGGASSDQGSHLSVLEEERRLAKELRGVQRETRGPTSPPARLLADSPLLSAEAASLSDPRLAPPGRAVFRDSSLEGREAQILEAEDRLSSAGSSQPASGAEAPGTPRQASQTPGKTGVVLGFAASEPLAALDLRDSGREEERATVERGAGSGIRTPKSQHETPETHEAHESGQVGSSAWSTVSAAAPPVALFAASSSSIVPHHATGSAASRGQREESSRGQPGDAPESRLSSPPSSLLEDRERGGRREGDKRALQSLIVLSITGDLYHVTTNGSFVWQRSLGSSLATAFDLEPLSTSSDDEPRLERGASSQGRGDRGEAHRAKSPGENVGEGQDRNGGKVNVEGKATSELAQTGLGRRLLPAHDGSLFFLDDDGSLTALHVSIPEVVNHLPFQAPLFPHVYFTGEREVRVTALDLETGQPIAGRRRPVPRGKFAKRRGRRDARGRRARRAHARDAQRQEGRDKLAAREEVHVLDDGSRRVRRDRSREQPFVFESLSLAPRADDIEETKPQETQETSDEDSEEESEDEPRQLQFGVTVWRLWAVDNKTHTTQWGLKWVEVDALGSLAGPGATPSSMVAHLRNILRVDDDKLYLLPSPSFSSPLGRVSEAKPANARSGPERSRDWAFAGGASAATPEEERLTQLHGARPSAASFPPSFAPFTSTSTQTSAPLFLKFPAPIAAVYVVGPPGGEAERVFEAAAPARSEGEESISQDSRVVVLSEHEDGGENGPRAAAERVRPWGGDAGDTGRTGDTGRRQRGPAKSRRKAGTVAPLVTLECIVRQWGGGASALPFAYVPSHHHAVRGDREGFPSFPSFAFPYPPPNAAHAYASLLLPSMRGLGGPAPSLASHPLPPGASGLLLPANRQGPGFDALVLRDRKSREVALPAPPAVNYLEDLKDPPGEDAHAGGQIQEAGKGRVQASGDGGRSHSLLPPFSLPTSLASSSLVPTEDRSPLSAAFSSVSSFSSAPSAARAAGSQGVVSPYMLHNFRAPAPVQPVRLSHPDAFSSQVTLSGDWGSSEFSLDSRLQTEGSGEGQKQTRGEGFGEEERGDSGSLAALPDRQGLSANRARGERETAGKHSLLSPPLGEEGCRDGGEQRDSDPQGVPEEEQKGKEAQTKTATAAWSSVERSNAAPRFDHQEERAPSQTVGGGALPDDHGTLAPPLYGVPPSQLPALYGAFDAAPLSFNPVLSPVLSMLRRWVGRLARPSSRFFSLPLLSPRFDGVDRDASPLRPEDSVAANARRQTEETDQATVCGVEDREAAPRSSALFFPSASLNFLSPASPRWLTPHAQAPPNYVVSLRPETRRGDRRECGAAGRRGASSFEGGPEPQASPEAPASWDQDPLLAASWTTRILFLLAAASSVLVFLRFRGVLSGALAGVVAVVSVAGGRHMWRQYTRFLLLLPPHLRSLAPYSEEDGLDAEEEREGDASVGRCPMGMQPMEAEERRRAGPKGNEESRHSSGGAARPGAWSGSSDPVPLSRPPSLPLPSPVWGTPLTSNTPGTKHLESEHFPASPVGASAQSVLSPAARALEAREAPGGRYASWAFSGDETGLGPADGAGPSRRTMSATAWTSERPGRGEALPLEDDQRCQDRKFEGGSASRGATEPAPLPALTGDLADDMKRLAMALESRARNHDGGPEGESRGDSGNQTPMYSCRTASSASLSSQEESERQNGREPFGDTPGRGPATAAGSGLQIPGGDDPFLRPSLRPGRAVEQPSRGTAEREGLGDGPGAAGHPLPSGEFGVSASGSDLAAVAPPPGALRLLPREGQARRSSDSPVLQTLSLFAFPGQGDVRFYRKGSSAAASNGGAVESSFVATSDEKTQQSARLPSHGLSGSSAVDVPSDDFAPQSPLAVSSSRSTGERKYRARAPSSPWELTGDRVQSSPFMAGIRARDVDAASILPQPLEPAGLPSPLPALPDRADAWRGARGETGLLPGRAGAPGDIHRSGFGGAVEGRGGRALGAGEDSWELRGPRSAEGDEERRGVSEHDDASALGSGGNQGGERQVERQTATPIYLPGGRMGGGSTGESFSTEEWQRLMFRRAGRRCNSVGQLTAYGGGHLTRGDGTFPRAGLPNPVHPAPSSAVPVAEAGLTPQSDVLPVRPGAAVLSPRSRVLMDDERLENSGLSLIRQEAARLLAAQASGELPHPGKDVDSASSSSPSVRASPSPPATAPLLPAAVHEATQDIHAVSLPPGGDAEERAGPENGGQAHASVAQSPTMHPSPIGRPGGFALNVDEARRGLRSHAEALKALEALSGVTTAYVGSAAGSVESSSSSATGSIPTAGNDVAGLLGPSGLPLTSAARLLLEAGGDPTRVEQDGKPLRVGGAGTQEALAAAGAARRGDGGLRPTGANGGTETRETETGSVETAECEEATAAALPPPAALPVDGAGATDVGVVRAGPNVPQVAVVAPSSPVPTKIDRGIPPDSSLAKLLENGRFERTFSIQKLVGQGGFGVVYQVRHLLEPGHPIYAVKLILLRLSLSEDISLRRDFREVAANRDLYSKHVVRYYTWWCEEPRFLPVESLGGSRGALTDRRVDSSSAVCDSGPPASAGVTTLSISPVQQDSARLSSSHWTGRDGREALPRTRANRRALCEASGKDAGRGRGRDQLSSNFLAYYQREEYKRLAGRRGRQTPNQVTVDVDGYPMESSAKAARGWSSSDATSLASTSTRRRGTAEGDELIARSQNSRPSLEARDEVLERRRRGSFPVVSSRCMRDGTLLSADLREDSVGSSDASESPVRSASADERFSREDGSERSRRSSLPDPVPSASSYRDQRRRSKGENPRPRRSSLFSPGQSERVRRRATDLGGDVRAERGRRGSDSSCTSEGNADLSSWCSRCDKQRAGRPQSVPSATKRRRAFSIPALKERQEDKEDESFPFWFFEEDEDTFLGHGRNEETNGGRPAGARTRAHRLLCFSGDSFSDAECTYTNAGPDAFWGDARAGPRSLEAAPGCTCRWTSGEETDGAGENGKRERPAGARDAAKRRGNKREGRERRGKEETRNAERAKETLRARAQEWSGPDVSFDMNCYLNTQERDMIIFEDGNSTESHPSAASGSHGPGASLGNQGRLSPSTKGRACGVSGGKRIPEGKAKTEGSLGRREGRTRKDLLEAFPAELAKVKRNGLEPPAKETLYPVVLLIQMEMCNGVTLREWLERKDRSTVAMGFVPSNKNRWHSMELELFKQLMKGIRDIHERGIVHRDLKPENIFVDPNTLVLKIVDFGLAKFIQRENTTGSAAAGGPSATGAVEALGVSAVPGEGHEMAGDRHREKQRQKIKGLLARARRMGKNMEMSYKGEVIGTPAYAAPEGGGLCDEKADIYSSALILLELLCPRFNTVMERVKTLEDFKTNYAVPEHIRLHLHPWYLLMKEMARPEPQHRPSAYAVLKHVKMLLTPPPGDLQSQRVMLLYPDPASPQLGTSSSSAALASLLPSSSSSPGLEPSAFAAVEPPAFPAPVERASPFSSSSSSAGAVESLCFSVQGDRESSSAEEP